MKPSVQKLSRHLRGAHRDDSGAVALLCLAAVLALMLVAWVILDAHKSTRDKMMLQGAADTAAFSHASVEARSMNMIAYANIAKRSIVGIHSLYPGMFFSYTIWLIDQASGCQPIPVPPFVKNPAKCWRFIENAPQWVREFLQDHVTYSGNPAMPYAGALIQTVAGILNWIDSIIPPPFPKLGLGGKVSAAGSSLVGGYSKTAYGKDVKALDNYQRYMHDITPWWAWSEQLARGWRNGATTVASFPPPPGSITIVMGTVQKAINTVNQVLSLFGAPAVDADTYDGNDNLPISHASYSWSNWLCEMFLGRDDCGLSNLQGFSLTRLKSMGNFVFGAEHIGNVMLHRSRSSLGAKKWSVIIGGATLGFATVGLQYSRLAFGDAANPYTIDSDSISNEGDWLTFTSNLIFAYHNDPDRMGKDRLKLRVPSTDYKHSNILDSQMYKSSGYWTMAKSEISFNGDGFDHVDMWHPSWTARLRPVHLPGEFQMANYNMNNAYNETLLYLALSAQVGSLRGSGTGGAILNSLRDMAMMEVETAAMGPSTIDGVGK